MIERFRSLIVAAYRQQPSQLLYTIARHHAASGISIAYNPTYNLLTKILYKNSMPATNRGGMIVRAYRDQFGFQYAAALLAQEMQLLPGETSDVFALFMLDPEPPIFASFVRLAGLHIKSHTVGSAAGAWEAAKASYAEDSINLAWDNASSVQKPDLYRRLMEDPAYSFGEPLA